MNSKKVKLLIHIGYSLTLCQKIFRIIKSRYLLFIKNKKGHMKTNGENVPHLEINEVILDPGNIGNSYYQHDSNVLLTFISNKLTS